MLKRNKKLNSNTLRIGINTNQKELYKWMNIYIIKEKNLQKKSNPDKKISRNRVAIVNHS